MAILDDIAQDEAKRQLHYGRLLKEPSKASQWATNYQKEVLIASADGGSAGMLGKEREKTISRKMELERQRLQATQPDTPLTPSQLSTTRKAAVKAAAAEGVVLKPGERVQGANNFFRSFDFDKGPDHKDSRTKWIKIKPAADDVSEGGVFSSDPSVKQEQRRVFGTTGKLPDGTFANPAVIQQAKKLDKYSMWPQQGPYLEDFQEKLKFDWRDAGVDTAAQKEYLEISRSDKGHIIAGTPESKILTEGGANYDKNLLPQPGLASPNLGIDDTPDRAGYTAIGVTPEGDVQEYMANVPLSNRTYKDKNQLSHWDQGGNVSWAFNDMLIRDDPNILNYNELLTPQQRAEMAHLKGADVDALGHKYLEQNFADAHRVWVGMKSFEAPTDPKKNPLLPGEDALTKVYKPKKPIVRAERLMNAVKDTFSSKNATVKVTRGLARAAGLSNNPLVNIAGDIIGAGIDGVVFAANPTAENAVDLGLSAGQVLTTAAGVVVAAVPIPGARIGAFAIIKLGDNIEKINKTGQALATIERLWGLGRETRDVASGRMKVQKGKNQFLEVIPSDKRMTSTPPSAESLKILQSKYSKQR